MSERKWPTFENFYGQKTKLRAGDIVVIHTSPAGNETHIQFFRLRPDGHESIVLVEGVVAETKIGIGALITAPHTFATFIAAIAGLHIEERLGLPEITGCSISSRHFLLCR